MRLQMVLLAAIAALSAAPAGAATVEVRNAVARIVVIPEDRSDVKVEVVRTNSRLPLTVRTRGQRTIVDGGLDRGRRILGCHASGKASHVDVRGIGRVGWAEMPQITIRTPRAVDVLAGGAVFGAVGRSTSLNLGNAGCGDWTVANVEGRAKVSQAGSGGARIGSTGALKLTVAGSGDVVAGSVNGQLDVNIAGSGDVAIRSVTGPIDVSIAGSGDVRVQSGRATRMSVSMAGSGDVDFGGSAESLRARIAGSGDVQVREVKGEVSRLILGSGSVRVAE